MESYYWYSEVQRGIIERLDAVSQRRRPKKYVLVNGKWVQFTEATDIPHPIAIWDDFRLVTKGTNVQIKELG